MLGNCAPPQPNPGPGQQPQPFNWMPVIIGVGILAGTVILVTVLVVFGRKRG